MSLIYAVFFKADGVYPKLVCRRRARDNLPPYAKDTRCSLFYRKLKGEQGCSYLFPQEYQGLIKLLEEVNQGITLKVGTDESLAWDANTQKIEKLNRRPEPYNGKLRVPQNPLLEATHLIRREQQFESYLQAYFTLNIDREPTLAQVCGSTPQLRWFANEVFAGSGMQKIDIFTILQTEGEQEFRIIELKSTQASADDVNQIARYARWTKVYVHGANSKNIQPVLFARSGLTESILVPLNLAIEKYREAKPIKYFEFDIHQDKLAVRQVT